jgi:hypothetical protein
MDRDAERDLKNFDPQRVSRIFHQMVSLLCDYPDEVEVHVQIGEIRTIFEVTVDEKDYGKVIGRKGRTAESLKTLMGATAGAFNKKLALEFSFKTN